MDHNYSWTRTFVALTQALSTYVGFYVLLFSINICLHSDLNYFKPVDSLILGYVRHSFGKEQYHEFVIIELYLSIQFYL